MLLFTILIVLFSLILLTALHELGHFLFAKKFGIKVEEFGIGYPPRIIGKKIKGTFYSLNLLPFGAFVKIKGEDGDEKTQDSFTQKPIWQRALVLFAGVAVFWVVAFLIFTFVSGIFGIPSPVPDETDIKGAQVQIVSVLKDSPAQRAGLKPGDIILGFKKEACQSDLVCQDQWVDKVKEVQDFISQNQEVVLLLERSNRELELKVIPEMVPEIGKPGIGVSLVRAATIKTAWYKAPYEGLVLTARITKAIPLNLYFALKTKIRGGDTPGLEIVGPIGFGKMLGQSFESGFGNFLVLMGMIAVWLALFNLFPIPALDGGRLLFLGLEALRKKPMKQHIEQKINNYFFLALIGLMVLLSIRDIVRLF